MDVVGLKEMWVSAWVDESASGSLAVGQPVRIVFRSQPDKSYSGEVARLARQTDRETREFLVDIRVKELPRNWSVGQRAGSLCSDRREGRCSKHPAATAHLAGGQAWRLYR